MRNTLITSGQKENVVDQVAKAARKGAGMAIDNFAKFLDKTALQRISANKKTTSAVMELMEKLIAESVEIKTSHLKCISLGKDITLDETDGTEAIMNAKDVWLGNIDLNFRKWGLDREPSEPTKKTKAQVFEMTEGGDFKDIFGSFGENLDRLCFTKPQIKLFCNKYADWLRTDGYGTLFMFKVNGEYFVAQVRVCSEGLRVLDRTFSGDYYWYAESWHRIVVPQL